MALFNVEKQEQYLPRTEDQDIICSVIIGNGQQGSYNICLDDKLKGLDRPATLGKKRDVQGRTTYVSAHVTDVLQETNWTSITVTMQEGGQQTVFGPYEFELPQQNDEVDYVIEFSHS
jgi:hypothetical protein